MKFILGSSSGILEMLSISWPAKHVLLKKKDFRSEPTRQKRLFFNLVHDISFSILF